MLTLSNPSLLRSQLYINGEWVHADNETTFSVYNPATREKIIDLPNAGATEAHRAIQAADKALASWKQVVAKERATVLKRWFQLIMDNQEDLARLMTAEQGKPLAESRAEVAYGASFVEWFAEEGRRVYGDTIAANNPNQRIVTLKQPVGVVAAITPWNFPIAMITRKVAPALAVGCTIVLKPATETPLCALALAKLGEEAGIPAGAFSVVAGNKAREIGGAMTSSPTVRKLTFTGSTEIGKTLMEQCAGTIKKTSMELGGNAPFIVFDDADLDAAVQGLMASKFRNAGQTCVCANRILVQESVYDAFVDKFVTAVSALKVGDGSTEGVTIGPLINDDAYTKVSAIVRQATNNGAEALIGGSGKGLDKNFFPPTVLANVDRSMDVYSEEIFGPVAPVFKFKTEEEAIRIGNDTPFGLSAYFYARDIGRIWRVSEGLDYGIVGINEGIISTEVAPFGGVKESGIGREGSKYGIDDYLEIKYLCMGGVSQ
ncbi:succinate-semialdehyde dehydrogenase (NADP(+)) [Microbulbifer agarilyticus]|uniref:Succinate-semialdehyde dehydrogenase (NADP(+)) n=1 Tax=Microbulbifer agarilyticus TaxID=260552 RepID=A0A1Q2M641_9GAMM|nr:NAD-dependent succinate-semialdehyde dehydrogenase [Microbulbifer agarilyticus]AQQ68151.1 succinate-semialdehyde dehydrogenase (NADP(+)) [Microbulbifer agarilyticus]